MPGYGSASISTFNSIGDFQGYKSNAWQKFSYSAEQAITEGPTATLADWARANATRYTRTPVSTSTITDIKKKYENTGFGDHIDWSKYTNRDGTINSETEAYLYNRYIKQQALRELSAANYSSLGNGAISFAGSVAGSLVDPINLASAMVPMTGVSGLAGKMIARTAPKWGTGVVASAAVGAAENALIAGTFIEPLNGVLLNRLGDPYTMQDYWTNIGMSALLGAGFGAVGGVFDPMGMRYVNQHKQAVLNDNIKKMSNASAELQDAAIALKVDAELKGNSASNVNKLFEYDKSMKYSNTTPAAREYGLQATMLEEIADTNISRLRIGRAEKTTKKDGKTYKKPQGFEASVLIDGTNYKAFGYTAKEAHAELNKQLLTALKKYQPTFTKQGDMWIAQYTRDTGIAKDLTGAGRTKAQATRELNARYSDLLQGVSDIERASVSAFLETHAEQNLQWKQSLTQRLDALEEQWLAGEINKREYNKAVKKLNEEASAWETDYQIATENISNYQKSVYDRQTVESPEALQQRALEIANDKPDGIVQENKNIQARNEQAEIVTQTDNTLRTFNDDNEARIFESELYENLTQTQKELVNENYAQAKSDAEIMNSGKVAEIMDRYISCRKGL